MTKQRLKDAKISKMLQARIVETSVESSMLFDCQARTWRVKEVKKLQGFVDRAYRYIWSNKTKPPLETNAGGWSKYGGCEKVIGGEILEMEN